MKNWFFRLCSTILVLALLVNMLPMSIFAEEFKEQLTMQDTVSLEKIEAEKAYVVAEVAEKRTEYTKEFLLSNGLHIATVYAEPVHYEKNGKWEEIDNTLVAKSDGTLRNTAGVWNVSLPNDLSSGAVSITKDGYTLSFRMAGQLLQQTGLEIMSESNVALQQISTDETVTLSISGTEQSLALQKAQTSTAAVQVPDLEAARATVEYPEFVLEKNASGIMYANVYSGTDVRYDLKSSQVKESVILSSHNSRLRGYRYTLNTGSMIPQLQDDNSIFFYDEKEENVIMVMPAPYLLDANYEYNDDILVNLSGTGGAYTLTYLLPQGWLAEEERAWPVILDPVVSPEIDRSNIEDHTIASATTHSPTRNSLYCGVSSQNGLQRIFLKYTDLPEITSADVIVDAKATLYKLVDSSNSYAVEVHKVNEEWSIENLNWAQWSASSKYNASVEDVTIVGAAGVYQWGVTDIVRGWYTGANTGMMFKLQDSQEASSTVSYRQFASAEYTKYDTYQPNLIITFRNSVGLEDYWDYTSASAGRAGTGYVNTYTGGLTWVRGDIGFGGNRMPVSISHVYNLSDAEDNSFGMGYGWRTNFNEKVYPYTVDDDYYVWEDGDGTRHYFKRSGSSNTTFKDDEGLELTLKTNGSGTTKYSITNKKDNVSYFDTHGRLTKQENNQATKSYIEITYTTDTGLLINTVTDGAGRVYLFSYNESGLLQGIYYKGHLEKLADGQTESPTNADTVHSITFGYDTAQNLTTVTNADNKSVSYTYKDQTHVLLTAQDIDGYKLEYTYQEPTEDYQAYRVTQISEFDCSDGDRPAEGSSMTLSYAHNQTTLTDNRGNKNILQFNYYGNVTCVQDDEGRAQYGAYTANSATDTGKANQLTLSSKLQNTVNNLLSDSSFENSTVWGMHDNSYHENVISTTQSYMGDKSLNVYREAYGPSFTVAPGETYTFSAYVKTQYDLTTIGIRAGNKFYYSETLDVDTDWTRLEVSYTNNGSSSVQAWPYLTSQDYGAWVDCVQLEKMPTASRYNLVQNSDFSQGLSGWTSDKNNSVNMFIPAQEQTSAAPQLDGNVLTISGVPSKKGRLKQTINVSGSEGDCYVFSGWASADSAPLFPGAGNGSATRYFCLALTFNNHDGTTKQIVASFNHGSENQWQYVSQAAVATKEYDSITIQASYSFNANSAKFDGIQLFKEEFGTSYTYDEDGNIVNVVDLQKKNTTYDYDENTGDLLQILEDNKAKVTYTYDDHHNVETATTDEGLVYSFVYDAYGNNTEVSIGSDNTTITSKAHYYMDDDDTNNNERSADGNYLDYTVDALDKVTTYSYNKNTGVLDWVKYPKDTDATKTEYTYDSMYRTALAECTTNTGAEMSVNYTYENDYLTSVETPTTTYGFTYGDFGRRNTVDIGDKNLASYYYYYTGELFSIEYGNGDVVEYEYDQKGRLIYECFENGDLFNYLYDNNGNLAKKIDSATGRTTTYYYDLTDRLMKYVEEGTDYYHSVGYEYDTKNNLTQLVEVTDGVTTTTSYTYDDDNRIETVTIDYITVEYTYDDYGRVSQKVTKNGGNVQKTESFTYTDPTQNTTSSQVETHTVAYGNTSTVYTYTYDNNGNITSVSEGGKTTSYDYDSANQLLREDYHDISQPNKNYTHAWTYDNAGNITSRNEYAYTTGDLTGLTTTGGSSYVYGDDDWGDLLTGYDDNDIHYDEIGNPIADGVWEYDWEHGRQLQSMSNGNTTWSFEYNADGMRTKRTDGTTTYEYVYNGSQLTQMTVDGSEVFNFTYDASGTPLTLSIGRTVYYYVTNLQGDVVKILDAFGSTVASYTYDAWGVNQNEYPDYLEFYNPLRYRGYVYDEEAGLYYLQSRYYDPAMGRFINADRLTSTTQGFIGNNMFAYCLNNPINGCDPCGTCFHRLDFWNDCEACGGKTIGEKWQDYYENGLTATFTYGSYFSANIGVVNVSFTFEVAFDLKGNVQLVTTSSIDATTSPSLSASVGTTQSVFIMPDTSYLEGNTYYGGVSASIPIPDVPISANVGKNIGRTSDGYWGIMKTTGISPASKPGVEAHGGYANTKALSEQFNIIDWTVGLLS